MRLLVVLVLLAVPVAAHAGSYENSAGYTLDLPPGWTTEAKPQTSPVVLFNNAESLTVKLTVAAKPGPLGAAECDRLKAQDEVAVKKAMGAYKSVPVAGPQIANAPATHYGFLYKDAVGAVILSRFAVFSRARATDHQWAKLNAVIPRSKLATAVPALEKLYAAFKWKAVPGPDAPASPEPVAAVTQPVVISAGATTTPPPPGEGRKAGGRLKFKPMSEADAKAMSANVTEGLGARTDTEKTIARQRTFGDTFKDPNNE